MIKYLVGGAVRDLKMGMMPKDEDYVWVGATPADMIDMGMKQVGADFPVFLDAQNREHALARIERKIGEGYKGFECAFDTSITIEQDLMRRDLTINAMAMFMDGQVIDPFGGMDDLKNKVLRHVNAETFKEDPLRVLRVARFLARWKDFDVAPETFKLLQEMAATGELKTLQADRVWKETEKALSEEMPSRFFVFLQMIGALNDVFPEVAALFGVPQPYKYHPEGDCFIHTMMVLDQMTATYHSPVARFAALCHDLGKATSDPAKLPHHYGHEQRGEGIIERMAERLPVPNEYKEIAIAVAKYHTHIHNFDKLNSKTIVKMFDDLPHRRYEGDVMWILPTVSECDHKGRTSFFANRNYPNATKATQVFLKLSEYKTSDHKPVEEIKEMKPEAIRDFNYRTKTRIVAEMRGVE
ncbi:putative tRNA nucleotidyltransferase-like protein [Sinorhizobium phage phiM12]|uniref:Putative tRNA nucleotidyltransferase-like protein n=1 Tax=Sinorhizobium phage phiM12 TaxID=1357423 RepID=S5MVS8_9CAUD|nr:tRNA nucleotidyltransferase [Sinorhizobium phage phiM12]AGR47987.1 putative tRNA nucleotidyltransferase-like protein [Sinorhizobium phage phiM12]AKF13174.1 putative tRNA nucleotidyltransferase-like protein [Sinorhizobium phage phiM19]